MAENEFHFCPEAKEAARKNESFLFALVVDGRYVGKERFSVSISTPADKEFAERCLKFFEEAWEEHKRYKKQHGEWAARKAGE